MAALIGIEEARARVLAAVGRPLEPEAVRLDRLLGRVTAGDLVSSIAVPGFDNSAMDGYAIRAGDVAVAGRGDAGGVRLRIGGESRAGQPAEAEVGAGEAISISTGAVLPAGADAVVRVEDTERSGADQVLVHVAAERGSNVRRAGEDIGRGDLVIGAGSVVGAAELGVAASVGVIEVECVRRPRVAVVATGDELRAPGEELSPGDIYNSNSYSVPALAEAAGADVSVRTKVADDAEATRSAIGGALGADVAVICGGVSVGEHDHVKAALADLGVRQSFWGVALRPGKPTFFGTGGTGLVFGLPGNPVSAMVTFILLVRPALRALLGTDPAAARTTARLATDYPKRPGRAHAARVSLELTDEGWVATPAADQGSHVLTSMLGADALAIMPADADLVAAGERVAVELLSPA